MKRHLLFAVLLFFASLAVAETDDVVEKRSPVPPPDKLNSAEALIRDIFKDDLKKTTPQDQLSLAAKFMQQAKETNDDPAARYKLMEMSLGLSTRNGDIDGAMRLIQTMQQDYQVDPGKLKLSALNELARGTKTKEQSLALAHAYVVVGESALGDDDYATASTAFSAAQTHARTGQDVSLFTAIEKRIAEVTTRRIGFEKVKMAKAKLAEKPDDPDANFIVGKFLCLSRFEWDKGLPMLGKADAKWSAAARADLGNPADAAGQVAVGDKWYDLGAELGKPDQSAVRARAGIWYTRALPSLTGLSRAKIDKRLQEISSPIQGKPPQSGPLAAGISESTQKALPAEEEYKEIEKKRKNGESVERTADPVIERLLSNMETWSPEDFKVRVEAWQKYTEAARFFVVIGAGHHFSGSAKSGLTEISKLYIESASTPTQFVERMKVTKPATSARPFIHTFILKHADTYPTAAAKTQFCDWLKQNGLSDPGIDEYKKDLEDGNDALTDPRSKSGKNTGGTTK